MKKRKHLFRPRTKRRENPPPYEQEMGKNFFSIGRELKPQLFPTMRRKKETSSSVLLGGGGGEGVVSEKKRASCLHTTCQTRVHLSPIPSKGVPGGEKNMGHSSIVCNRKKKKHRSCSDGKVRGIPSGVNKKIKNR